MRECLPLPPLQQQQQQQQQQPSYPLMLPCLMMGRLAAASPENPLHLQWMLLVVAFLSCHPPTALRRPVRTAPQSCAAIARYNRPLLSSILMLLLTSLLHHLCSLWVQPLLLY